jgi:hypothetical protein
MSRRRSGDCAARREAAEYSDHWRTVATAGFQSVEHALKRGHAVGEAVADSVADA